MIEIVPAGAGGALEQFIALAGEYLNWTVAEIPGHFPDLDLAEFTAEHEYDDLRRKFPGEHVPPHGALFLALDGAEACGCIALGRLDAETAEVRTLYVRPAGRGKGVGGALARAALAEARRLGYRRARLDTLGFMESAQRLYRSLGFHDIPPYRDVSDSLKRHIRFFELDLEN